MAVPWRLAIILRGLDALSQKVREGCCIVNVRDHSLPASEVAEVLRATPSAEFSVTLLSEATGPARMIDAGQSPTIRNAVYRIQEKLGVATKQEIVVWAVRNGLLDDVEPHD